MRFEVAHGQMEERELEQRMLSSCAATPTCSSARDHRVGDRHPAGEHADRRARRHFGLSSSTRSAGASGAAASAPTPTCCIRARPALTAEAAQRLAALSDYTELGAGFKIAMRDLELRGAGNLLGDEQSGHVAALGFELYMQMLDEAVRRPRAEGAGRGLGAGAARRQRRRLRAGRLHPLRAGQGRRPPPDRRRARGRRSRLLREELLDRFGEPPEPLENLLALQRARIKLGQRPGARAVTFRGGPARVTPIELDSAWLLGPRSPPLSALVPAVRVCRRTRSRWSATRKSPTPSSPTG
jgi:transcription-repair coupling factor (superfamily II helicase)